MADEKRCATCNSYVAGTYSDDDPHGYCFFAVESHPFWWGSVEHGEVMPNDGSDCPAHTQSNNHQMTVK